MGSKIRATRMVRIDDDLYDKITELSQQSKEPKQTVLNRLLRRILKI